MAQRLENIAVAAVSVALVLWHWQGLRRTRRAADELVSDDIRHAMQATVTDKAQPAPPPAAFWANATTIVDARRGYLQQLDEAGLADWASKHGTAIRLLAHRGDYVFPEAPIAVMSVQVPEAEEAIRNATALGDTRGSAGDAEYAVRQLVEVAVRALSVRQLRESRPHRSRQDRRSTFWEWFG